MFSSPVAINHHVYHDTSSSSSSLSSCSSLDLPHEECPSFNHESSQIEYGRLTDDQKQSIYWSQHHLSPKQSGVKRRRNDRGLKTKLTQLTHENDILRAKINMLIRKFGQIDERDELKSTEQLAVFNTLDQSSKPINQVDHGLSITTTEQLSSMPIKWRF